MINYFRQLLYDMRHQKMMTWVTVSGTAVSIFLVMVFFMVNSLYDVEVAPETNRKSIYYGRGMHVKCTKENDRFEASGGISYSTARDLYGNLEGVEEISYTSIGSIDVKYKGKSPIHLYAIKADGNYWKMYDFNFIEGAPFTEDECFSTTPKMVLSRSSAHRLFGSTDVVGRELNTSGTTYVVCGVVEDVNPILTNTWADVYVPLNSRDRESQYYANRPARSTMGYVGTIMLRYASGTDPEAVRNQVKSRYATLNSQLAEYETEAIYHGTPYDNEMATELYSNQTPDLTKKHRLRYIIYVLLIILPALNLSSMVRGRLQRRVSEIGVRRAYGAKRITIVKELLGENFIVTIVGGIIGLGLSLIFMTFLSSEFFAMVGGWGKPLSVRMSNPDIGMLFTWHTFFIALGICLVLNILTATVPAWRAASVQPAEAISKSRT